MVTSKSDDGRLIEWIEKDQKWIYSDTHETYYGKEININIGKIIDRIENYEKTNTDAIHTLKVELNNLLSK